MSKSDKLINALNAAFKVKGEVDKIMEIKTSSDIAYKSMTTGQLNATNDNLNKLRSLAKKWNNQLIKLTQKDENWWIEWSGTNVLSVGESEKAVEKVNQLIEKLEALKEACSGLSDLVMIVFLADHMDIKGLADLYVPSLVIIDKIVADDASTTFKACSANSDKIITILKDKVLPVLKDSQKLAKGIRNSLVH